MKKTEKRITQGEKVMAIGLAVLVVTSGISLYLFMAERGRSKDVEAGEGIAQAVFTRTGAVVELSDTESIKNLEIYDGEGTRILTKSLNRDGKVLLADFDWTPYLKYRFDVNLKDGSKLSTPGYAPDKPQPYKLFSINYDSEFPRGGEGNYAGIAGGASFQNVVDISDDGKYIAMAMQKGRIGVVDIDQQKEIWSKYIDKMKWRNMRISEDSNYLICGGTHTDAPIYVFNLKTGAEVWNYMCIQDLGAFENTVANARTTVTQVGSEYVWVASTFGWTEIVDEDGTRSWSTMDVNESLLPQYRSHVYCFELATGKKEWEYPKQGSGDDDWGDGMINKNINGLMVNPDGKQYVLIQTQSRTPQPSFLKDFVSVLDAKTGEFLWRYDVDIVPHTTHSSLYSSFISPDGKYVTVGPEDGRLICFDNEKCVSQKYGTPLWILNQGEPLEIDGVITHAGGGNGCVTDGKYVLSNTGITFDEFGPENRARTGLLYGGYNGKANLYVYNLKGELLWSFEGRLATGPGNLENQNIDLRSGYFSLENGYAWETSVANYPVDDKNSMLFTYSQVPTESRTTVRIMSLDADMNTGVDHFCWSVSSEAALAGPVDVSSDGTYAAFITCPKDYSMTTNVHDIRGYYELNVYT